MRKPLFTKPINLKSRTNLARLLQWNLQKSFLAEIGPLQYQLDQLNDSVKRLDELTHIRSLEQAYATSQSMKYTKRELLKITIGYGAAILILSLGCLIGFLVN